MRKLALTMLFIVGCAAAPTSEQDAPPIVASAESVRGELVVLGPDDVGGGGPSGGVPPATGAEPGGDTVGDSVGDTGGTCEEDSGETCEASFLGDAAHYALLGACGAVASVACDTVIMACVAGHVVTVGATTIPCGLAVVGACLGAAACVGKVFP